MRHGIAAGCVANLARGRDWERDLASHNRGPKRGIDHSKESEDTLWKLTSSLATLLQNVHKESFRGGGLSSNTMVVRRKTFKSRC